ncbi:MAG TPA: hypothetical protein VKA68_12615 [bacterium]|nr:hypothetical protein [bacterium]
MTTTNDLLTALQKATEQMTGRTMTTDQLNSLVKIFNQGSGADFDRALHTISEYTNLSREEILNKSAQSEDTDQAMMELEHAIREWHPKA